MSTANFPNHFNNSDNVIPTMKPLTFRRNQSEQCIVIQSSLEISQTPTEQNNVRHNLVVLVAHLLQTHSDGIVWVDSDFNEILNVRGWIILPDLDTLSREPVPENLDKVLYIMESEQYQNVLIAHYDAKIDIQNPNFVGWMEMPSPAEAIGHLKDVCWK